MDVNNGMGWLNRHEQKMSVAPIYEMVCRDGSTQHTSQSPMEDMEDSVESGIRVTKETEK